MRIPSPLAVTRAAHDKLSAAVRAAYGMKAKHDSLSFLFSPNHVVAEPEEQARPWQRRACRRALPTRRRSSPAIVCG